MAGKDFYAFHERIWIGNMYRYYYWKNGVHRYTGVWRRKNPQRKAAPNVLVKLMNTFAISLRTPGFDQSQANFREIDPPCGGLIHAHGLGICSSEF